LRITINQEWFLQQDAAKSIQYLLPLAFTGGLIAVVSPCQYWAMLPINLS